MPKKTHVAPVDTRLRKSREEATTHITEQFEEANVLLEKTNTSRNIDDLEREYGEWYDVTKGLLRNLFTDGSESRNFASTFSMNLTRRSVSYFGANPFYQGVQANEALQDLQSNIKRGISHLSALLKRLKFIDEEQKVSGNFESAEPKPYNREQSPLVVVNNNNSQHGNFSNTNNNEVNQKTLSVIKDNFNSLS